MKRLIVIPTAREMQHFLHECRRLELSLTDLQIGKCKVTELPDLSLLIAQGGLGKVQFALQTQYLIDSLPELGAVICAGSCGGLAPDLRMGDVVVATETIEHDVLNCHEMSLPVFPADQAIIEQFRTLTDLPGNSRLLFGPVASGDEDVMSDSRKNELLQQTNAVATAWEGAGGARACRFNNLPFAEVRVVSDFADCNAKEEFYSRLEDVMANLAVLLIKWAQHTIEKTLSG